MMRQRRFLHKFLRYGHQCRHGQDKRGLPARFLTFSHDDVIALSDLAFSLQGARHLAFFHCDLLTGMPLLLL